MTTRSRSAGTADQYESDQQREWSQYTAIVPIDYYGTRAYNVGDPVPASAVQGDTAWVDSSWVAKRAPFEGSATVVDPAPPTIDPTTAAAPAGSAADVPTTTEG